MPFVQKLRKFNVASPKMEDVLFKVGRVTGLTEGMYANLKVCRVARRIMNGNEIEIPTWEHAITVPRGPFIESGDSGSLILTGQGDVQGIAFGGSEMNDIGYFTSARDLLEDIKHFTDLKDIKDIRVKDGLYGDA